MKNSTWQIDDKEVSFESHEIDGFKNMCISVVGNGVSLTYIDETGKTPGVKVVSAFAILLYKKLYNLP